MTTRTAVHRWGDVPHALLDRWSAWPGARFVHQTADYAAAAAAGADPVYVAEHRGLISSFTVGRGRAVCLFTGRPTTGEAAGDDLVDLARAVHRELDVALVYFPYLDAAVARAAEACAFLVWERTASPFIDWSDRGVGLAARVRERYGSRAERQWRRFASARLTTVAVTGTAAVEVMDRVESASWKASAGQSMHEREDQFALYSGLIERGAAELAVVYDDSTPAAYRLDTGAGRVVACLKWSYDERYRRYSPGFQLLTTGLADRWSGADLEHIDLFGSPDLLKDLVATGERRRFDLAWPDGEAARQLRRERTAFDAETRAWHEAGRGVRRRYLPEAS
jgi:hypothetical protein